MKIRILGIFVITQIEIRINTPNTLSISHHTTNLRSVSLQELKRVDVAVTGAVAG